MMPGELSSGTLRHLMPPPSGYRGDMPFFRDDFVELCIDAYEANIRVTTDLQLTVARVVDLEPVRSFAATCADLTRDIGATQVSSARWILDV
jgi:hypothetical protein